MEITINLKVEDWIKYQLWSEKNLPKRLPSNNTGFWKSMFIWAMVIAMLFALSDNMKNFEFHLLTGLLVGVFFIVLLIFLIVNAQQMKKAFEPNADGVFCGDHTFIFDDKGIHSSGSGYHGFHSWQIVKNIEREDGVIMIFLDTALAFLFPEDRLDDPEGFYAFIKNKKSNSNNG